MEVTLPWAVDMTGNVSMKVMRKRGFITCTFPRAARWPLPVPNHLKMDLQSLPLVKDMEGTSSMSAMFTLQEVLFTMKDNSAPGSLSTPPFYGLRKSIHRICALHFQKKEVIFNVCKRTESITDADTHLTVLLRGMKRDHLNRLVLELVYNDHERADAMMASGEADESVLSRNFVNNLNSVGMGARKGSMVDGVPCSSQELVLFRELLEYNGMATIASDWQRKRVPSRDWRASFIIPLEANGADVMPGMSEDVNVLYGMINGPKSGKAASKSPARPEQPKKSNSMISKIGSLLLKEDAKHDNVERSVGSEGRRAEKCKGCGKRGDGVKLKRCAACFQVAYCGSACQLADWVQHKIECKKA